MRIVPKREVVPAQSLPAQARVSAPVEWLSAMPESPREVRGDGDDSARAAGEVRHRLPLRTRRLRQKPRRGNFFSPRHINFFYPVHLSNLIYFDSWRF